MADGELGKIYSDGAVIFRQGDTGNCMYVIQSGTIRIIGETEAGGFPIVTLGAGDIFGELALFDRLPRSATAVVEGEARLLHVDKAKLFSTICKDPSCVLKIIESMCTTIRRLSTDFTSLNEKKSDALSACTNTEGVCTLILTEMRKHIPAEHGSVRLLGDDGKTLETKASFGSPADVRSDFAAGEAVVAEVLRTGNAERIRTDLRSVLHVPLQCGEKTFGVVSLSREAKELFSENDVKLLSSFAVQGGIALRNSMDMAHLSRAAEEILKHASILGVH